LREKIRGVNPKVTHCGRRKGKTPPKVPQMSAEKISPSLPQKTQNPFKGVGTQKVGTTRGQIPGPK